MKSRVLARSAEDGALIRLRDELLPMPRPRSQDLFSEGGKRLPCWLQGDERLGDDWLIALDYYPLYYNLFHLLSRGAAQLRFLEIGVRTGYVAVVFFRAVTCHRHYVGVDPNEYVRKGLRYARNTLSVLKATDPRFGFELITGYSTDPKIQSRLRSMPPFDLVHIDGDHSLVGKLRDLEFARHLIAPNGLVLVDDVVHHPLIEDAVARSLALGWYDRSCIVPTKRGLALLGVPFRTSDVDAI